MKETEAREKLNIIGVMKENTGMVISIGGFVYLLFQFVVMPIAKLEYKVSNILDNHLATIQTELTEAKTERDMQGKQLTALSEQLVRLSTQLESKK